MKPDSDSKLVAFSTFTPLNYFLNLVGLSYIYRDGEEVKHSNSIWKPLMLTIIFTIINIIIICFKFYGNENETFGFQDSLQMTFLFGFILFFVDITLVYKYGRQSCVCYFNLYEYIDSILGILYYNQIRASIRNMCIFFLITGFITVITDYFSLVFYYGFVLTTIYTIDYVYFGIRLLSTIDMISNCIQVTYRLKTIGDLLQDYYYDNKGLPRVYKVVYYNKMWVTNEDQEKQIDLDHLNTINYNKHNIVIWLTRCYLLLTEQCVFINTMYGFRFFLMNTLYILDMVIELNLLIRVILGTVVESTNKGLAIVTSILRASTLTLVLVYAIYCCEQNYRETERIIRLIDHLIVNKKATIEVREALTELRDLIISRPIYHHAANFYRLDYSTLVSITSVIVTYSIIFLQSVQ